MNKPDICIVGGAGHIGLPLAICFAREGLNVLVYDINEKAIETINNGIMPFKEEGGEGYLESVIGKSLELTSSPERVKEADFVILTIGTPVDEHLNPTFHSMKRTCQELSPYLNNDQIVVLRSTIYPETTDKVRDLLKQDWPGIEVCFCPERIAEGKAFHELYQLPQIVAGYDQAAIDKTSGLFKLLTEDIIYLEPLEAELAKLFTNSWRYIQFATSNQFYMMAEKNDVSFHKIMHAMTHNYPRAQNFPGPGFAAGPCLFKDTMQLSSFARNTFFLGHSAMLVNEGLPDFIVEQAKKKFQLKNMNAGILGMAFKAESDDIRESLSFKLKKRLEIETKNVLCSDTYIKDENFVDKETLMRECDIVFIGAPHKEYQQMDFSNKIVIDVWAHIKD